MHKTMKKISLNRREIRRLETRYRVLASRLGSFESLSQGSIMPQPPGAWRWTRKVNGKTVSAGLPPAKAERMKRAIANHRALERTLEEMREITRKLILLTPETPPLSKRANPPKTALT